MRMVVAERGGNGGGVEGLVAREVVIYAELGAVLWEEWGGGELQVPKGEVGGLGCRGQVPVAVEPAGWRWVPGAVGAVAESWW